MDRQIWREIRRQALHLLGALLVLPILFMDFSGALKVLVGIILLSLFAIWLYEKRQMRSKYFETLISSMKFPSINKKHLLANAQKFEKKLLSSFLQQFRRRKEHQPFYAAFAFLLTSTICLILFGKAIAIFAILALAFGDSASALIGKKFGQTKLPWNKDLSAEGSIAFFAAASLTIYIFLIWQPQLAIISAIVTAVVAALIGMFAETIPTVNDNTTIPLAIGAALFLLALLS